MTRIRYTYTSIKLSYPVSRFVCVKPIRIGSSLCDSTRSLFVHLEGNDSRFSWTSWWGGIATASNAAAKASTLRRVFRFIILKNNWSPDTKSWEFVDLPDYLYSDSQMTQTYNRAICKLGLAWCSRSFHLTMLGSASGRYISWWAWTLQESRLATNEMPVIGQISMRLLN